MHFTEWLEDVSVEKNLENRKVLSLLDFFVFLLVMACLCFKKKALKQYTFLKIRSWWFSLVVKLVRFVSRHADIIQRS